MINIKTFNKVNLKGYAFIEGFPGAGLVGPMAISYIVDKMKMDYIGYIESDQFPPIIAIHDNKPMPAVRLYADSKSKVFTILAEFAVPLDAMYPLSDAIFSFIKAAGVTRIISISGIPMQVEGLSDTVAFTIMSDDTLKKDAQAAGLKRVGEGVTTGVSALLMLKAAINGITDLSILIPVDPNVLNPKYAELAILNLNKLLKLNVDISELDKEAKEVQAKINEIIKRSRESQDIHKRLAGDTAGGPSMYA